MGKFEWRGLGVGILFAPALPPDKHSVIPAKAGIHPEVYQRGYISRWIPAFAGMTSWLGLALRPVQRIFRQFDPHALLHEGIDRRVQNAGTQGNARHGHMQ